MTMLRRSFLIAAPLAAPALGLRDAEAAAPTASTVTLLHCNDVYEIAARMAWAGSRSS
jgi:hypothetical protein